MPPSIDQYMSYAASSIMSMNRDNLLVPRLKVPINPGQAQCCIIACKRCESPPLPLPFQTEEELSITIG
jgi:hypothetical protein